MKRKNVKFYIGKQPCSVWRITFVSRFLPAVIKDSNVVSSLLLDKCFADKYYLTYFVFAVDYPSALKKLSFVSKDKWDVYTFERFREFDYNLIYEL